MTGWKRLLIAPLALLLAIGGAPAVSGQGTPAAESATGTCLPTGGIPQKDHYLIGMSQANKGEPWRQAMNDQIAAAAAAHPELEVVFADAAQNNAKPCNIIEIRGLEGSTPAKERGDGFREGIASDPNAKIIAQQNADWLREKAIPVSQAMFQANPDVNVVYGHNDPMAEAAIISAQNAGLNLDDLLFIGIDALPTPDGGIRSVLDGRIDVTYVYPTGGSQAIDYATQILEQGAVPPDQVVLETEEVVPDNAQQLLEKYGGGAAAATPGA